MGYAQQLPSDDDVHRMSIRAGETPPPDDPDEQVFAQEQGEHLMLAEEALQAGQFKRSIFHLGLVLADDPVSAEALALLDQWIEAAGPHALEYVPLDDPAYFPTLLAAQQMMRMGNTPDHRMEVIPVVGNYYHAKAAVHAYILVAQGRAKEGAALLVQLLQVKPEIPSVLWIEHWQGQPGLEEGLEPDKVAMIGAGVLKRCPGTYLFSEHTRMEAVRYLPLLGITHKAYPQHEAVASLYAGLLRKVGQFEESLAVAQTLSPSYFNLVPLAMAEEALGNLDASIAAYQRALTFDPQDVAVRNDLGKLHLVQGKLPEALALYEESTRLDPSDPYQQAFAYVAYLKALLEPENPQWQSQLQDLARRQSKAHFLNYVLHAPFLGRLPYATEALLNVLRNVEEKYEGQRIDGHLQVANTVLESPSARLAFGRVLASFGATYSMTVDRAAQPDTRQPLRPVEYQLWRYEGMDPSPNVPPPDAEVAARIAALAQTPYNLEVWHGPARRLGQELGPGALNDLLGVMVHPPAAPAGWKEYDWLWAVQLASALTIAFVDSGWEGSRRKAALTSLAYGPMDWSGAAAIVALAVLARQETRLNIEFDRLCLDLWSLAPDDGDWALERAIVYSLIYVEEYSEAAAEKINAYFARLQREREQSRE